MSLDFNFNDMCNVAEKYNKLMKNGRCYTEEKDNLRNLLSPSSYDRLRDVMSKSLHLPEYQRYYTWQPEEQVKAFLDTVLAGLSSIEKGNYVCSMGNMIILMEDVKNEIDAYIKSSIIDGQQRITTAIAILIVIRDMLNELSKDFDIDDLEKVKKYIALMQKRFMWKNSTYDDSEEETYSYALNTPTREDYNNFLHNLMEKVGITSDMNTLVENLIKDFDGKKKIELNVRQFLNNIEYIREYFRLKGKKICKEDKVKYANFLMSFADYIYDNIVVGVIVFSNPIKAREAYFKTNFTGQNLSWYEGFKYMVITMNSDDKHVEYSMHWDRLKEQYKGFANKREKEDGMGFLSLTRSNNKGRYTNLPGGHTTARECDIYDMVRSYVVKNNVPFVENMFKQEQYFNILAKYTENKKFSNRTKLNILYLYKVGLSPKYFSALIVPFEIFGEEGGYAVMENYTDLLVKLTVLFVSGKETTNVSVYDDLLDKFICAVHRKDRELKFIGAEDFKEFTNNLAKTYYTSGNQSSDIINRNTFRRNWMVDCNVKSIQEALYYSYEFILDKRNFVEVICNDTTTIKYLPLLDVLYNSMDSDTYSTFSRTRWSNIPFDNCRKGESCKVFNNVSMTKDDYGKAVDDGVMTVAPNVAKLWRDTFGRAASVSEGVKLFGGKLCDLFMDFLDIQE